VARPWHDKVWWCWVRGWDEARIRAERRRFTGNTFYYARNKAALHFQADPLQVDGEQLQPMLGPPAQRSTEHNPWYWMKSEEKDEPKRAKGAGGKKPKKRKAKAKRAKGKRRGKATRRDP
jgi:hypothetical protein